MKLLRCSVIVVILNALCLKNKLEIISDVKKKEPCKTVSRGKKQQTIVNTNEDLKFFKQNAR